MVCYLIIWKSVNDTVTSFQTSQSVVVTASVPQVRQLLMPENNRIINVYSLFHVLMSIKIEVWLNLSTSFPSSILPTR